MMAHPKIRPPYLSPIWIKKNVKRAPDMPPLKLNPPYLGHQLYGLNGLLRTICEAAELPTLFRSSTN